MNEHFGEHLIIDGYGCNPNLLSDENVIAKVIQEIIDGTEMKQLSDIVIKKVVGVPNTKDTGGVTGMVVINESHISIHTFTHRQYVSIDVFTCKNGMNVEKIKNICKFGLEIKDYDVTLIKRGLSFPSSDIV